MKTKNLYKIFLLLAFWLCTISVDGQRIRTIDNRQGLPDNSVNCITQDANGFVWMGTSDGLARYDGSTFYTYRHKKDDESSIINSNIYNMLPVKTGIYISTERGVDFYSFTDGRFHHCLTPAGKSVNDAVTGFAQIEGKVIFSTGAGCLYEIVGNKTLAIQTPERVYSICPYGKMLFAVGDSKVMLLTAKGRLVSECKVPLQGTFTTNSFSSRNTGLVYVGNGFGKAAMAFGIKHNKIVKADVEVPSNLTSVVDYAGGVAFGTDGKGVVLQTRNGIQTWNTDNGLCGYAVYSLYTDRQGNLWVGTYRTGASVVTDESELLSIIESGVATAVAADESRLFIGLDGGGLSIVDKATGKRNTYTTANSTLSGNNIISMAIDQQNLWMAVYGKGLEKYNLATGKFQFIPLQPTPSEDVIWAICDDQHGNIWVGGKNIFVVNKKTGNVSIMPKLKGKGCSAICYSGGYVWIGNEYGLYKIDAKTRRILAHFNASSSVCPLPDNYVRFMRTDSNGRIWMAFKDDDVCRLDMRKNKIERFGLRQGLTCNNMVSLVDDGNGQLWVGTTDGLFRFVEKSGLFIRMDGDNRLPGTYTIGAVYGSRTSLYLGSSRGVVCINVGNIPDNPLYKAVSFTSLTLTNGRRYELNGSRPQPITLAYDENFFTVGFGVPEYSSPRQVNFTCYLKGLEQDWREMSVAQEVSYTNVPPGHYELLVQCLDVNGKWTATSVLDITITPPWYMTWWAKLLWGMMVLLAVYIALRLYLHELDNKHQLELASVERESERRLNEAKTNFYTSITHELRTPVFLISAQLEELLQDAKEIVKVPLIYLDTIHRNALRLNELVNRVVDFRKVGAENLKLNTTKSNVVQFCRSLARSYSDMFYQKNIEFEKKYPDCEVILDFDPLKLELIISNLMTNAFKYTKKGGKVVMTVNDEADRVVFSVKDNGIGIDNKYLDTIFESFFRSDRGKQQSQGDGLGLSFVKSLVELHGGEISVKSEMGKGSDFTFYIPKNVQSTEKMVVVDRSVTAITHKKISNPAATHTILIIDDEQETVDILTRYLEKDFKIEKAYNGEEGLSMAAKTLPDIILCDIMMPKMNGLEFLKTLKNYKNLQGIKVIIFTADTSEDDMMTAFDSGADAYITKPISLQLLRKRIDRMIAETDNSYVVSYMTKGMTMANGVAKTNDDEAETPQEAKRTYTKEEQIFLLRCREIIDDNLTNSDFNIDFLADSLAMSHSTLYKKMKAMTGMSLIEFINDYRIYKAVQLFRHGETNVSQVAEACGISDPKNFRTLFKRKMNITPKQFVQNL